jgi:hypothetical protein
MAAKLLPALIQPVRYDVLALNFLASAFYLLSYLVDHHGKQLRLFHIIFDFVVL